jgi:hypothetical protein
MITFDIKNAFNSAEWGLNRSEVDRWNMCGHITRLVDEYLSRRYLWVGRKKNAGHERGTAGLHIRTSVMEYLL